VVRDSTVFFVYDDGGKKDPILFRQYIRRFFSWYNPLSDSIKRSIGNVGVGLNIESLRPDLFVPVIEEEFEPLRTEFVRLQIVLYADHGKDVFESAMRIADSVVVHLSCGSPSSIASAIGSYTTRQASGFLDGEQSHLGLVSFAIRQSSALSIAQSVYDEVIAGNRRLGTVLNKRSFLLAHSWETL
jgi:hypothetical protein